MEIPKFKFALVERLKDKPEFLPMRSHQNDTGFDVRAAKLEGITIHALEYVKIPLGIRAYCPDNYWLSLVPRSSSFIKKNLSALYGTIDEGFFGELHFLCTYIPNMSPEDITSDTKIYDVLNKKLHIEFGERIGQLIPVKRQEMIVQSISNEEMDTLIKKKEDLSVKFRGAGGFGSTDKKNVKAV